MYLVIKTSFRTSKTDLDRLFACNRESARVWNDCLSHAKEHHKQTGKWIGKRELQALTKGRYHLHSQSIQSIQERYLEVRKNAWKAKQAGFEHIRYPYKTKCHYPTRWKKDGFTIHYNGRIELSMGIVLLWIFNAPGHPRSKEYPGQKQVWRNPCIGLGDQ